MSRPTLGIIIATPGRRSIARTLWSIAYQSEGVEDVLVIGDGYHKATDELVKMYAEVGWLPQARYVATQKTRDWGHTQLNYGLKNVRGDYVLYTDDDDIFLPRALEEIRDVAERRPGRPIIGRIKTPELGILWQVPDPSTVLDGHCLVAPNVKEKLGYFDQRYFGDQCYIHTTLKHYQDEWVWHDAVYTLTRPMWTMWPQWASRGSMSWCCDLHEDHGGVPGKLAATVLLEEDGEHWIGSCNDDLNYAQAQEVVEFLTWAGQGKSVWFRARPKQEKLRATLLRMNYKEHWSTDEMVEYTSEWPPYWWAPVPRFSHLTDPDGTHHPDWRDEWPK